MPIVTTNENTYGFEIEFCTHDNTILRYTHIEIAEVRLVGDAFEDGNTIPLKLETDSGDVLELVTPPIIFKTVNDAAKFRKDLAEYLKSSVKETQTFSEWWDKWGGNTLINQINTIYTQIQSQKLRTDQWIKADPQGWNKKSFKSIYNGLSINNIDDGINIAAANKRKFQIQRSRNLNAPDVETDWQTELNKTILSASSKDWPTGYSTQTSFPMEAKEYVNYVISHKLLKSNANLIRLEELLQQNQVNDIDKTLQWDKVERWATTWFWGGVIIDLFSVFIQNNSFKSLTDFKNRDRLKWSKKLGQCNEQMLAQLIQNDWLVSRFIIAQKTLTGALGQLSEPPQLQKQHAAYQENNTAAMEQRDFVRQPTDGKDYYWCEYHSGLKDLLGVWFKGHLADVLELLITVQTRELLNLHTPTLDQLTEIYTNRLNQVTKQLEKFKRMPSMSEFTFIQEDGMLEDLVRAHLKVIEATANFVKGGSEKWGQAKRDQDFLAYSSGDTLWEGRKDTMIKPIKHQKPKDKDDMETDDDQYKTETFFLVEHRNN